MNDIRNDKNLQEAVNRREQRLEPMPSDLNDRLMKRLSTSPREEGEGPLHPRLYAWRRWSAGLAAALAASFLLMWLFNFSQTPSDEAPLLAQQTQMNSPQALTEPVAEESQSAASEQSTAQPSVVAQGEAEPQAAASAPAEMATTPRQYNPQAIPDIASPRGELLLASTSHTPAHRRYDDGLATHTASDDGMDDGLSLTADKDKGGVSEGWKDLKSWSNKQSIRRDLTKKERKQMAVLGAIGDKRWHIDITSMNTMRYGARTVSTDFFLELRGDTLRSYLPYLGQAQVSPSLSPTVGLNFEERVRQYQESRPKEKYTQIDIDVKTKEDTYHYVIDIYDSGDAYIRVRSLNRDPISFDGTLETKY